MIRGALATWLLVVLVAAGCGRAARMPRVAFPMQRGPTRAGFELLVTRARDLGYVVDFSDAEFGSFGVTARSPPSGRDPERAAFVVQCHADGHATIEIVGTANDGQGHARVTPALRREVVRLAQELEEGAVAR